MNEFIKKMKNVFLGDSTEINVEQSEGNTPLTNQELEDKVLVIYKKRFKEETTRQTMLFPTCFRIYLHTTDFKARQAAFNILARDMANEFNRLNREEMHKYRHNIPHAKFWLFQFVEFKEDTIVDNVDNIKMGEVYTLSTLYSQNFSKNRDNIGNEGNITMTKQPKNSTNAQELDNININAFLGMDMLDGNRFQIKINDNYDEVTVIPQSEDSTQAYEKALACLVCDKNFISGQNRGNTYNITANYIEISGKGEVRSGSQYAKIDYPLPNSIVHIKYENGRFLLAAFGKVRLNQILVRESKGAPDWTELSDNSKMLICDEVSIEFKRK